MKLSELKRQLEMFELDLKIQGMNQDPEVRMAVRGNGPWQFNISNAALIEKDEEHEPVVYIFQGSKPGDSVYLPANACRLWK